ncbi:3-deoxy-7-phosphoheptulonate synthase [Sporanaerobium hydrogeniformans]|uniref:3-deoxy-7-phosphoheptulonate synthase n=1 Tax=Sporanaerobium hydrogeniformans TaxID=3072179 RepID=A0AC61DE94_9FIRM|nr:3-deoxy-7-phosphoheptulonate synthase [Sporanaerobium hydrogeniformans]PHV71599.1 3-deoxy-7-phosphoheptulonate synthase [Sporanaerobium hydrogeniformans]
MIIVMKHQATPGDIKLVTDKVTDAGLQVHISEGSQVTIIGVVGDKSKLNSDFISSLPCVEKLVPVTETYKLANKMFHTSPSVIDLGNCQIGGKDLIVMAGPCAIESKEQLFASADSVKAGGATVLRGGAYKPRTSPYSFQGLEEQGLLYMLEAKKRTGLSIVCEVTSIHAVNAAVNYVDILQVGARNMQNFELLKAVGKTNLPVLLKRGLCATIDEWLNAAEYIMSEGNQNVILCERGIRTYETATRNTLDISAIPVIKSKSHLPIIVDPSHASGKKPYIPALSKAAIAAGADGLMIEVHPNPKEALSDGPQSLNPEEFKNLMNELKAIAEACGRTLSCV